ncbi:MAG: branched-chain amino acid ABC transporter permease [Deltaproteobacteria bacterium]|nr:branched-chain amino acid ABC transporter permease [Deltaproteobacteria bacterium]
MKQRSYGYFWMWGVFLLIMVVVLPFLAKPYQVCLVTEMIIFALFAVSYNLLLGYAGLLSFGHAMFFGAGAYATAVALIHIPGLPFFGAFIIGTLVTTFIGFALGILLLRHKGAYYALLTLAFNVLFYAIATKWHSVTGGDDGLSIDRPDISLGFAQLNMSDITTFYYVTLLIIGSTILYCWYFNRTAMGQTVLLMRENEERMKFLGYNSSITRLILFTFTAGLAGLAGSFYALFFEFTSVSAISLDMTTIVLLMTFIGGTGAFIGPILGSCVYIYLQDLLSDITDRWPLIMGAIFILMVLYVPGGLSGIFVSLKQRWSERVKSKAYL